MVLTLITKNIQKKNKMQSNNNEGLWVAISNFFASLFSRRPAEDKVIIKQAKIDTAVQKAEVAVEVKVIKQEARTQKKINKKIIKDKKAFDVTKLKQGRGLWILDEYNQRKKILFDYHTDLEIVDIEGNFYSYGKVHTYHGRPVVLNNRALGGNTLSITEKNVVVEDIVL